MTHFIGLALIEEDHTKTCRALIDELLAPFSANLEVPEHVMQTRDEWLKQERSWREKAIEQGHSGTDVLSEELGMDDDEFAEHIMGNGDYRYDGDGNRLSTRNPDSHYDYYDFSSLRNDSFERHQGDTTAHVANALANRSMHVPICVAHLVGGRPVWKEEGRVGWFGSIEGLAAENEWRADLIKLLRSRPQSTVFFVNFHI